MRILSPTNGTMRKLSLIIRKVKIRGKKFYQVNVPDPTGKRPKRKTFASESDAETFLESAIIQKENFGAAAFSMTDTLRTDATKAAEILAGTDKSLVEAARFFRAHLAKVEGGIPLKKAVTDFLAKKRAEGASDRHKQDLRNRLNRFLRAMPETATTANVSAADIDKFLSALGSGPQTCMHYRTIFHTFFKWCKKQKHCSENPVTDAMTFKVVPTAPGILSPADAADLLASCDPAILPGVVIGMFCGLRQAEIARLDWRNVDLAAGIITVGANIAKTSSRRTVEIPENAKQWLSSVKQDTGKIWPENEEARNLWNLARIGAGFGPFFSTRAAVNKAQNDPETKKPRKDLREWPDNALRHSAISYRLAMTRDLPRVATEAGNSPGIIQRHYAELVKPAAATKFFSILPKTPANVETFHSKAA